MRDQQFYSPRELKLQRELELFSTALAHELYNEGFSSFRVSIYPGYPFHVNPTLAETKLKPLTVKLERTLKRRRNWLSHVYLELHNEVISAGYETRHDSFWSEAFGWVTLLEKEPPAAV